MMLTTHLHMALRLRMGGTVPLLPLYVFMDRDNLSLNEDKTVQVIVLIMLFIY